MDWRRTLLILLFLFSAGARAELMQDLDECEATEGEMHQRLETVAETVQGEAIQPVLPMTRERSWRRERAYLMMEIVRWYKTRCVQDAILNHMGSGTLIQSLKERNEGGSVLAELALYQGFKASERQRKRCPAGEDAGCARESVIADLERQTVLVAIQDFFDDLDRGAHIGPHVSLRVLCLARLARINERIEELQASVASMVPGRL